MFLKLHVLQNGSAVKLYAYADSGEEGVNNGWFDVRQIQISHNDSVNSLSLHSREPLSANCINDYKIIFYSSVSFKHFCEQFSSSDYNNPVKYSYMMHNCAGAVNYALKLAHIDLQFGRIKLTSLSVNPLIRLPTPMLTPIDLYYAAKKYKIASVKKSSLPFKVELAASSLSFWARSSQSRALTEKAKALTLEVNRSMRTKPEKTELYLEALLKSLDRLISVGLVEDKNSWDAFIQQFKKQRPNPAIWAQDINLNLNFVIFLMPGVSYLLDYSFSWQVTSLIICIQLSVLAYYLKCVTSGFVESSLKNIQETPLSLTVTDFFCAVEQHRESESQNLIMK